MKERFYNPQKAEEEKKVKAELSIEDEKRKIYFERIKKDKNFQRYIVDEIIRENISALTDTSKLLDVKRTKEELADLIIANVKASATLTNIFAKIIN